GTGKNENICNNNSGVVRTSFTSGDEKTRWIVVEVISSSEDGIEIIDAAKPLL
ncbi:20083_t:CDS:2, partial [Entrophospora sp. SA101]